jgi:hypothetical protein
MVLPNPEEWLNDLKKYYTMEDQFAHHTTKNGGAKTIIPTESDITFF